MAQILKEEKLIYTTHEVAKILHSSPNYIYELIEKGKLKAIKLKSFKIRKSAVEEFLKENTGVSKEDTDFKDKFEEYLNNYDKTYYTYEEFNDYNYIEYETYVDKYNTPNGDTVVAFGYYGENY